MDSSPAASSSPAAPLSAQAPAHRSPTLGFVPLLAGIAVLAVVLGVVVAWTMPGALVPLLVGIAVGAVGLGLAMFLAMPRMMLVRHASRYGLDETCERLRAAIEAQGWRCPAIRNMTQSIAKEGVTLRREVRIVELCQADYARQVLETNPEVSTLMPCALGVYEGADGKVYVSGMNTGLMGKVFGGRIAEVMGNLVSADEARILARVVAR